jgi:hypothetical protein
MCCELCASCNQAEFPTEIAVHLRGRENLARPHVLIFPKVLVCIACGFSRFTIQETELRLLKDETAASSAV